VTYVFAPPAALVLPVSLSRDIVVVLRNRVPESDPASYVDFPDGVDVKIVVGKDTVIAEGVGVIDGDTATCRIPSSFADRLRDYAPWRVVVTTAGTDDVPLNGYVMRRDGVPT
jgi:hypothetical protein